MTAVGIVVAVAGAPLAAIGLYQCALAVAALAYRPPAATAPSERIAVLVPAHNESALIERCVRSLKAQTYPDELYRVIVIADNCTDDTAARAATAGAEVLERDDTRNRGKGHALRWAFDRLLAERDAPDAVAVVDADSVAVPTFLEALVRPLADGAEAAQGESLLVDDGTPRSAFRAAAFLLINRTRPAGRAVLGLAAQLAGNGMLVRRAVLERLPWDAFSSTEDLEYSLKLRRNGVRVGFAGGAELHSPTAPTPTAALEQQLRWEGGKLHHTRVWLPKMLRAAVTERRPALLDAAIELAVPPLGLFAVMAGGGAAISTALAVAGAIPWWAAVPWLVALAALPLYVLVGLRAARAPASAYRALLRAPLFVLGKLRHVRRFFGVRGDTWVPTERADDTFEE